MSAARTCSGSTSRSERCPRSISMSGHASSPNERAPDLAAECVELVGREHAPAPGLTSRDALELAELLERVDAHVRVRADADRDAASADALGRKEAVAEVGLGRRARADRRRRSGEEIELGAVRVRRMDDRRALREAAGAGEQLDRAAAVLGEALLDLFRLLVGVDVQRELVSRPHSGRSPRASRPGRRARSGGRARRERPLRGAPRPARGTRSPTPAGSAGARRARTRRGGARARRPRQRQPRRRRAPPARRGSGTRRRPCTRPRASPGSRARSRSRTSSGV